MTSIFTKIINGDIPSYKIAESEQFYAFLDINPVVKGHTLVVPKVEVDYIYDLEDELLGALFVYSKKIAKAIEQVIPCKRVGITVVGLEVPHAHVHLMPFTKMSEMSFANPRKQYTSEEFQAIATSISEGLIPFNL